MRSEFGLRTILASLAPRCSRQSWMSRILQLVGSAAVVVGSAGAAYEASANDQLKASIAAAANSITKDEVTELVDALADDTFEGRDAGSRGGRAAGTYLVKKFEDLKLKPIGDQGTYFQNFQYNGVSRNIVGLIEGSDEKLKNEVVVIGAHYDHVGYGRTGNSFGPLGYIHNGADDNASGTTGLLEIMEAIAELPTPPRRSVMFALWDAEEHGLIGSKHWVSSPTIPLDRVVFYLNLDMIGRLGKTGVEVIGSRTMPGMRKSISQLNTDSNLTLDFTYKIKEDSDHHPFFAKGIPFVMYHTGLHDDYHRPSDDADRINADGVRQLARLSLLTILEVANADQSPSYRPASVREIVVGKQMIEQPAPSTPPRFGMSWNRPEGDKPAWVVTSVTPGSPCEKAGLKSGDKLLTLSGRSIDDDSKFRLELLAASGTTELTVERAGEAEPVKITVEPAGSPIRIGITWREDPAEPQTVLLTSVVPGSAAHQAGLEPRDRIYTLAGKPFADTNEFRDLISKLPSPIELTYERMGKIVSTKLNVLGGEAN